MLDMGYYKKKTFCALFKFWVCFSTREKTYIIIVPRDVHEHAYFLMLLGKRNAKGNTNMENLIRVDSE